MRWPPGEGLANYEKAWTLTSKGAQAIGYLNPKRHFQRLSLGHDVKLSELRLVLEDAGIARSWFVEEYSQRLDEVAELVYRYFCQLLENQSEAPETKPADNDRKQRTGTDG